MPVLDAGTSAAMTVDAIRHNTLMVHTHAHSQPMAIRMAHGPEGLIAELAEKIAAAETAQRAAGAQSDTDRLGT